MVVGEVKAAPSLQRIADLTGQTATVELKYGPFNCSGESWAMT